MKHYFVLGEIRKPIYSGDKDNSIGYMPVFETEEEAREAANNEDPYIIEVGTEEEE
ncbi:MAG: hypothetical protein ACOC4Y_01935 [bacterium]